MRANPTEAERRMWLLLKERRFADYKFRRQVPIGPFIADFVCHSARLIVEFDGSQHAESAHDVRRDRWFAEKGFSVLRIWNNQLTESPDAVSNAIFAHIEEHHHG